MYRNKSYLIFSVFLFLFFILPWIYLTNFAVLQIDDFCRTGTSLANYFSGVKTWYLNHNGRYINAMLSLLPVYDLNIYRGLLTFFFLLFGYSIYSFLESLLTIQGSKDDRSRILFFTMVILIGSIAILPDLNEFFFWFAAVTVYQFSAILFLFFISYLYIFWYTEKLHFTKLLFLIIFINGNLELLAGITNFLLLIIFLFDFKRHKRIDLRLIILNLVSWISTLLLIYSPGMTERRNYYNYGGDFLGAMKVAIVYGAKFISVSMFDVTSIFLYIFSFLFIWKSVHKASKKMISIPPALLLIISYISIISMVFILYYASGVFDSRREWRVSNMMRFVTLIIILINISNFCYYLRNRGFRFEIPRGLVVSAAFVMLFSLGLNSNYRTLLKQIILNQTGTIQREMTLREDLIKKGGDTLVLNYISRSGLLRTGDAEIKNETWVRECFLNYVNSKYEKNYSTITFLED